MTTVANIITNVGYRLFVDGTTISATTQPTQAECIQWINETCEELLTVCVELGSELGRTAPATISLVDGTATYTDLAATMFAPVIYKDMNGDHFSGWIEKTTERVPLRLTTEQELINYVPDLEKEPEKFYINGSNALVFIPTPDTSYTAKIPYYSYHTALTLTTDTIPFLKVFDHVITESVVMRAQNREEYELGYELRWFQYIRTQARKIILTRKNLVSRVLI